MPPPAPLLRKLLRVARRLPIMAVIFSPLAGVSPLADEAVARPPRAERRAARVAERRYARMSIAEARAVRAEARVAEIAPVVPVPPPPRPATVRRLRRAGVPLGPTAQPAVIATRPPLMRPAAPPAASEPGVWRLDPDDTVTPATAEVPPDGTRSVLSAGGAPPAASVEATQPASPDPSRPGPAVRQPAVELLPTPEAN